MEQNCLLGSSDQWDRAPQSLYQGVGVHLWQFRRNRDIQQGKDRMKKPQERENEFPEASSQTSRSRGKTEIQVG